MQVEKNRSNRFGCNGPLYKHCSCKRSQSTDVDKKLSFCGFQVSVQTSPRVCEYRWHLAHDNNYGPRCARLTWSIFASPAARQICRLGQPCAPRAKWHSLNISRYSLALGEYFLTYIPNAMAGVLHVRWDREKEREREREREKYGATLTSDRTTEDKWSTVRLHRHISHWK